LKELFTFIKKHHTTGLVWNPRGGDAGSFKGGAAPSAPSAAPAKSGGGGPPAPPPAPSAPLTKAGEGTGESKGPGTGNLFAEINKGGAITSGLKKVTKDMKSKFDPTKTTVITETEKKSAAAPKATAVKKGVPKLELSGNKWLVEWQENNNSIEINETELKQTIYIYKCEKSVIRIKGKVNSVSLDGCKRVSVVFEHALALCEMVNCSSIEVQCTGRVPSVAIDKCSGVQFFLSKDGLDVEIVSSKSDQMNILIPDPSGGQDPIEIAIPEQFKTLIKNNKLVTSTVEHV
jgi:adenylyl cyclase-associated protein